MYIPPHFITTMLPPGVALKEPILALPLKSCPQWASHRIFFSFSLSFPTCKRIEPMSLRPEPLLIPVLETQLTVYPEPGGEQELPYHLRPAGEDVVAQWHHSAPWSSLGADSFAWGWQLQDPRVSSKVGDYVFCSGGVPTLHILPRCRSALRNSTERR